MSKHVGLRGFLLQEALENRKLELEKVDTATNPADVCTKALPGNRIRELCRLARVYVCCSEEDMGDDPDEWYLSRLDMLCRGGKFEPKCHAESEGRVLISHVSIVSVRLISHQQLDMSKSIPNVEHVLSWRRFHVNSSQSHFDPVVNFQEIRVFQACICDQRF